MGRSWRLLSLIFLVLGIIALFWAKVSAQTVIPQWTLLDKSVECSDILKKSPSLKFVERRGKLLRRQIELCILDIETGDVSAKRYWLDNKDIDRAYKLTVNHRPNPDNLPRFMPVDPNDDLEIVNIRWNGWNSYWNIETVDGGGDEFIVVADKYSLSNSRVIYPDERTGSRYSDIVYTPYSDGFHDSTIVSLGLDYLDRLVDGVFEELEYLKVESVAFPGRFVTETVTKRFIKEILLVEQTDAKYILHDAQSTEEKLKVAEMVLVRYGLNGDRSFRYSVSPAGAWGMAQIMFETCNLIVRRFPGAELMRDCNLGRLDPRNAVKTQILVFDDHLATVRNRVNNSIRKSSRSRAGVVFGNLTDNQLNEVRAMIYNGGPGKYNLATGGLNLRSPGASETKDFIEKYRVIRSLNIFE